MRFIVAAILALHGLIHLLGPIKAFGWATVPQLRTPISMVAFCAAIGFVFFRPVSRRGWLGALLAGMAWLVVWYASLPVGIAAALNVVVIWVMFAVGRAQNGLAPTRR